MKLIETLLNICLFLRKGRLKTGISLCYKNLFIKFVACSIEHLVTIFIFIFYLCFGQVYIEQLKANNLETGGIIK